MPVPQILRLGLRQFAAGMLSVLTLGILNRVMKIELGLGLGLVSAVIGIQYFAAFVAIPLGHRSDTRPWRGYHRTPYIALGTGITALTTALAPPVVLALAGRGGSPAAVVVSAALFLLMGLGMHIAGTAYLSLIADLTTEGERGKVVAITWAMMMVGILAGVFLSVQVMEHYSPGRLVTLFLVMAALVTVLTALAVWGREHRRPDPAAAKTVTFAQALRVITLSRMTRRFFSFLFGGILFLFLQQMALEPFGADVFGLGVKETTLFNAYQMVGTVTGMGVSGGWLAARVGKRTTAGLGLVISIIAFTLLALASLAGCRSLVRPSVLAMGLGMGAFTVGGLALMMDLTAKEQVGLFMGTWTLAQALANGLASVGGGIVHDAGLALWGSEAGAYASVFLVEAGGLLGVLVLLLGLDVARFQKEVAGLSWQPLTEGA